jgi:hypothetical protein
MRGRIALQKRFPHTGGQAVRNSFHRFAAAFGVRARPRAALGSVTALQSSGTLSPSVLNEYTDFTNPVRALVSNQAAEHHGY